MVHYLIALPFGNRVRRTQMETGLALGPNLQMVILLHEIHHTAKSLAKDSIYCTQFNLKMFNLWLLQEIRLHMIYRWMKR